MKLIKVEDKIYEILFTLAQDVTLREQREEKLKRVI